MGPAGAPTSPPTPRLASPSSCSVQWYHLSYCGRRYLPCYFAVSGTSLFPIWFCRIVLVRGSCASYWIGLCLGLLVGWLHQHYSSFATCSRPSWSRVIFHFATLDFLEYVSSNSITSAAEFWFSPDSAGSSGSSGSSSSTDWPLNFNLSIPKIFCWLAVIELGLNFSFSIFGCRSRRARAWLRSSSNVPALAKFDLWCHIFGQLASPAAPAA